MLKTQTKLTCADYLKTSDDERYELLSGELVMSPPPKRYINISWGNSTSE